ncbi:MAG: hypothetical protein AB7U05_09085 [Mangrovibacterium sp.]
MRDAAIYFRLMEICSAGPLRLEPVDETEFLVVAENGKGVRIHRANISQLFTIILNVTNRLITDLDEDYFVEKHDLDDRFHESMLWLRAALLELVPELIDFIDEGKEACHE